MTLRWLTAMRGWKAKQTENRARTHTKHNSDIAKFFLRDFLNLRIGTDDSIFRRLRRWLSRFARDCVLLVWDDAPGFLRSEIHTCEEEEGCEAPVVPSHECA